MVFIILGVFIGFGSRQGALTENFQQKTERLLYPIFKEVIIEKDITYRETQNYSGENISLKLDVYQPQGDSALNRPAVVWIHGGSFKKGSKEKMSELALRFAKQGYVRLSINYRLRENPEENIVQTVRDAVTDAYNALRWLRKNAEQYRVNPNLIVVGWDRRR